MKSCDMYEGDYKLKARFIGEILGQRHLILKEVYVAVHENDLLLKLKNWAFPKNRAILSLNSEFLDVFI